MKQATNGTATGTAKTSSATGKEETPQNKPEQSPEQNLSEKLGVDKNTGELKEEQKPGTQPSIEARLKKLEQLNELVEKRDIVVGHLENLNKFYTSPSGQGSQLKLTDSKNLSFVIANPIIIGEIVHMSKVKMQDELNRIEEALTFNL